ncbi:MAG: hypothetical protein IT518_12355 [Burkholderiales bacterium]|nr:hypothetical protein [Burkholderiales bacterium]
MQSTTLVVSLAVLAALAGNPVLAAERHQDEHRDRQHAAHARPADGVDTGMHQVMHSAGQGEPGHGWQYFSDAAQHRAVVISPQGDYYLSRGKGLRWVAAAPKAG